MVTTKHDGTSQEVVSEAIQKVIEFAANTTNSAVTISGSFKCDHGDDINYTITQSSYYGYRAIDLGLPSKLKWASCNVGADKPEEYGKYFQWGDVEGEAIADNAQPTRTYDWTNAPYKSGSSSTSYTKYTPTDGKTVLEPSDDAAHAIMGGNWRMPTSAEFQDLYDNTTREWVNIGGVNGYRFTSTKEGYTDKSIFIPASGSCDGTSLILRGAYGYYWSSSLYSSNPLCAYNLFFNSGNVYPQSYGNRRSGFSVRGVVSE